ncbi:hypothetical protein QTP88_025611 [Uroleucon formosanum]
MGNVVFSIAPTPQSLTQPLKSKMYSQMSNKWGSSRKVHERSTGPDWFETKMANAKLEKKRSSKCFWSSSFVVDPTTHFHYKTFTYSKTSNPVKNVLKIPSKFISTKSLLQQKNIFQPDLNLIIDTLKKLPAAFSETLKILQIINTLPVSTVSNERFFSSLKRVKSYIRSSMGDERLSDLMVIAVEKEDANKIDLDEAVDRFSKKKIEGIS